MSFDYQYFLKKPKFIEKFNIDLNMGYLMTEKSLRTTDNTQIPVTDIKKLLKTRNNRSNCFIALLLCGGKAIRFNNQYKAVFEIPNAIVQGVNPTFLELNIKQIVSYEKKFNINVPVIIYDDFATREPIKKLLKSKHYFGKNKNDFTHVMQTSWFRYLPNISMLKKLNLLNELTLDQRNTLPKNSVIYRTGKLIDSVVGTGHFIFNSLITSDQFRQLVKFRPEISKIVVSNCDNLGKKYFPELVKNDNLNYVIVTDRKIGEKMDGVYTINNCVQLIPYFKEKDKNAPVGFTGTAYISIESLIKIYNFQNKKDYLETKHIYPRIGNTYDPIIKVINTPKGDIITLHFESVLSNISKFLDMKPIYVKRDLCFFPFKTIKDVNEKYISTWRKSINKYII